MPMINSAKLQSIKETTVAVRAIIIPCVSFGMR